MDIKSAPYWKLWRKIWHQNSVIFRASTKKFVYYHLYVNSGTNE